MDFNGCAHTVVIATQDLDCIVRFAVGLDVGSVAGGFSGAMCVIDSLSHVYMPEIYRSASVNDPFSVA